MNILSFDIEEWYIEQQLRGCTERFAEFDRYLERILDLLDERGIKASFFCVGKMGVHFPSVIKRIQVRGHEIGCHSNTHTWLNKMTESECREDTRMAIDSLEQCIGVKVKSYRAPSFSICESNKWAFEVLAENGIERDASVFPAARDLGGFKSFGTAKPCVVEYKGIKLKEFPVSISNILGKEMAYSGGGYFRLLPYMVVNALLTKTDYTMCYFHINDLLPDNIGLKSRKDYEAYYKKPGTFKNRYLMYIKTNLGKKSAFIKLEKFIKNSSFVNLDQAEEMISWNNAPVIVL